MSFGTGPGGNPNCHYGDHDLVDGECSHCVSVSADTPDLTERLRNPRRVFVMNLMDHDAAWEDMREAADEIERLESDLAATRAENERLREALAELCDSLVNRGIKPYDAYLDARSVLADGREETDGR